MGGEWVLLSYRLPREPSAPRVALWRRLKRLGVAQVSDGLVALPADARTREQLEWVAEEVAERGGTSSVWLARPSTAAHERDLAAAMAADRATEWTALAESARTALASTPSEQRSTLARLRRTSRQVTRRDFFPAAERDAASAALRDLENLVARHEDAPAGRTR
ncbi:MULTISPECIES: Chromate resistance protein ChrB [unclassified Isoptericola]|uniref:Chromate resistance protein ChrB n=1 Tax=unclassified Isoptericola TaxID=2623355 RepID=UPI0036586A4E